LITANHRGPNSLHSAGCFGPSTQGSSAPAPAPLSADQLDSLVAPIALYPDALVAQVLAAATNPDQVAYADDWLSQNRNLTGSSLAQAVDQQSWDPSVKALTQFPSVLNNLAHNLSWTSSLGQAFANQQADVMTAVQTMRAKAQAAGALQSNSQITVTQPVANTIAKYAKMNRWVDMTDGSRVLYIGADNFAFPVPLAKNSSGQWYFDGIAGAEEVRTRNIGRNELLTIDACSALATAQQMYFANGGESGEYAQHIVSTSGKQDGLYWPASKNQALSPLASLNEFPKSSLASISPGQPLVIDGYTLRILTAQGDEVPGGAMSYIVNGKMTGGFAVLATPVKYAETGIMTFMTGSDGAVFERDLGPDTANIAASIQQFNPTDDWSEVE